MRTLEARAVASPSAEAPRSSGAWVRPVFESWVLPRASRLPPATPAPVCEYPPSAVHGKSATRTAVTRIIRLNLLRIVVCTVASSGRGSGFLDNGNLTRTPSETLNRIYFFPNFSLIFFISSGSVASLSASSHFARAFSICPCFLYRSPR